MTTVSDHPPAREMTLPDPVALPASPPVAGNAPLAPTESELRREAIRRTLTHHAGKKADAKAMADATLYTLSLISTRLTPVIGVRGVDVLFRRALHLTQRALPELLIFGGEEKESAALLTRIKSSLAECKPAVAAEASYTLLVTFTELLTPLIGESLVARLFDPVWVSKQELSL
ncbi:MAG: hypothetical protein IBX46_09625 [Desulfuromonadales bacterium]|nr:hypothetical protein [Desulfuromonadales bacterium]